MLMTTMAGREPMNGQPIAGKAEPHLLRRFGLLQATALNMSNMIGIGPFITIPALMSALGGPQAMLGWIVALLIAIPDGMIWSELGAAMPGSGGSYLYLRRGSERQPLGAPPAFGLISRSVSSLDWARHRGSASTIISVTMTCATSARKCGNRAGSSRVRS